MGQKLKRRGRNVVAQRRRPVKLPDPSRPSPIAVSAPPSTLIDVDGLRDRLRSAMVSQPVGRVAGTLGVTTNALLRFVTGTRVQPGTIAIIAMNIPQVDALLERAA